MSRLEDLRRTVRRATTDYPYVHRPYGRVVPFVRALVCTVAVHAHVVRPGAGGAPLDTLTCSVAPRLTALWIHFLRRAMGEPPPGITICDCTGSIGDRLGDVARVVPFVNLEHGRKLDALMRLPRSEFVLVSDDDVFFLSDVPLRTALDRFQADPDLAVVSFLARDGFTWPVNGAEHTPMGSYCLVVRRETWMAERLRWRPVAELSPSPGSYNGLYDTADHANVQLLRRGYHVEVMTDAATSEHFVAFKAVSSGLLKLRKGHAYLPATVWGTYQLARRLDRLFEALHPSDLLPPLLDDAMRAYAQGALRREVSDEDAAAAEADVVESFGRLTATLDLDLDLDQAVSGS